MSTPLDLDQLKTFIAIAETGSFTKAADEVFKTQSAVSMQMRRLEERIGQPIFIKEGRVNKLSDDGERLLSYARKLMKLNDDTICAFSDDLLEGSIRFGTPDDYADRFIPKIIADFSKSHPQVELNIICESSPDLYRRLDNSELDIAIVTHGDVNGQSKLVRTEPLYWVSSLNHLVHEEEVVPLAIGREDCCWRSKALQALEEKGKPYRILVASHSATVDSAAVLAGLAVAVLPECALEYGMRILTEADGYPPLGTTEIGVLKRPGAPLNLVNALCDHIFASLDNSTPRHPTTDVPKQAFGTVAKPELVTNMGSSKITW